MGLAARIYRFITEITDAAGNLLNINSDGSINMLSLTGSVVEVESIVKTFALQAIIGGPTGNWKTMRKFAYRGEVTETTYPADIWDFQTAGAELYTYTANTGATYYFSSSDNSDTQTVYFGVLTVDSNGNWNNEEFTQDLVGQTKTALSPPSGDPVVRIYRVQNRNSTAFAGNIYVYEDDTVTAGVPSTATKVRAHVDGATNSTLMSQYTIPTGYVGFVFSADTSLVFSAGPLATETAIVDYNIRPYGGVFILSRKAGFITTGTSAKAESIYLPPPIPAKSDLKVTVDSVSDTMGFVTNYDIVLVPEEELSSAFLTSIGQIERVT